MTNNKSFEKKSNSKIPAAVAITNKQTKLKLSVIRRILREKSTLKDFDTKEETEKKTQQNTEHIKRKIRKLTNEIHKK